MMSETYKQYVELREMLRQLKQTSDELCEIIRIRMDGLWFKLTESELNQLNIDSPGTEQ